MGTPLGMIDRIAVVGTGFMGGGIGAEFALRLEHDVRVTLWDARPGGAATAVARAREVADALVEAGILLPDVATRRLARLGTADTLAEVTDGASYVVEAVPEDLPTKQEIFRALDRFTGPDVILASNTSGFDPADLADGLMHPGRVVVAHYFGPAFLIPLVEVVPHPGTVSWVTERTAKLLTDAGKRPAILGRFVPGFVANRLQQALFREALHLVRNGVATPEVIDEVARFSFGPRLAALGPFTVADFAGLDVYASLSTNVWPDLSAETASGAPPPELVAHVVTGTLGVKTGAGTYPWPPGQVQAVTARRNRALGDALRAMRNDD